MKETVNHPSHYNAHPSGVESATISSQLSHAIGSAWDYVYRFRHKKNPGEDLRKALWWVEYSGENFALNPTHWDWVGDFKSHLASILLAEEDDLTRECLLQLVATDSGLLPFDVVAITLQRLIEREEN